MARRRPSLEAQLLELPSFYAAAAAAPPTQQSPKQRLTATFARFRRPSHHARAYSTTEIPPVDMPSPRANDSKRFSLPGVMTKRKARSSMDEEVARTPHWDTSPLVTTLAYLTGLEPRSPVAESTSSFALQREKSPHRRAASVDQLPSQTPTRISHRRTRTSLSSISPNTRAVAVAETAEWARELEQVERLWRRPMEASPMGDISTVVEGDAEEPTIGEISVASYTSEVDDVAADESADLSKVWASFLDHLAEDAEGLLADDDASTVDDEGPRTPSFPPSSSSGHCETVKSAPILIGLGLDLDNAGKPNSSTSPAVTSNRQTWTRNGDRAESPIDPLRPPKRASSINATSRFIVPSAPPSPTLTTALTLSTTVESASTRTSVSSTWSSEASEAEISVAVPLTIDRKATASRVAGPNVAQWTRQTRAMALAAPAPLPSFYVRPPERSIYVVEEDEDVTVVFGVAL